MYANSVILGVRRYRAWVHFAVDYRLNVLEHRDKRWLHSTERAEGREEQGEYITQNVWEGVVNDYTTFQPVFTRRGSSTPVQRAKQGTQIHTFRRMEVFNVRWEIGNPFQWIQRPRNRLPTPLIAYEVERVMGT